MGRTTLKWEDVIQFEEVKGYGQHIWRDSDKLYYVTEEGGIAPKRVVYELPYELFTLLESGERTLLEVSWKIKHDSWPPTELEELIPIAEKIRIESKGNLPWNYVSPLEKGE